MEKSWKKINHGIGQKEVSEFAEALQVLPITAQILISRGISNFDEAKRFISPDVNGFHNPFLMKDLDKAIARIKLALDKKEKILIYGDYDVDGTTSIVLLMRALSPYTSNLIYYIPHRLIEGYGLSKEGIELAKVEGVRLIITADCGISAAEEIKDANSSGIDVIVTDHHEIPVAATGEVNLPPAFAIINPKQPQCQYPDKNLAGVGVVMKLIQGLMEQGYSAVDFNTILEFACLGTIADIVPLIGENRIIARYGLTQLQKTQNIGLKALIKVCGLEGKKINSGDIGFKLGPRINAMGRLEDAKLVISLFLTDSRQEAEEIAKMLDEHNQKRQKIQEGIFDEAVQSMSQEQDKNVLVMANNNWHSGVIGIVASKLVDRCYRPTILISCQNGLGKGSGRSIPDFNLLNALIQCDDLLESYGGHEQAAGLTILTEKIDEFRQRINDYAHGVLQKINRQPSLDVFEVQLKDISFELINELEDLLSPFGIGNPRPVFSTNTLEILGNPMIVGSNHLKMRVKDSSPKVIEAIGFNMGDKIMATRQTSTRQASLRDSDSIALAYTPQINIWQDRQSLQLNIKDIKF
ncbi:MAG: single-stranded-DNA-specific exonuclease RecJ [bacterium]|nr:single-stranded-DNA-specific exonuclease RecJ [bacterium]